ncbi:phosphotransferase enzyme family protein [Paenibacillus tengchongensis]|uniref:phosphotransferase enzyme family protein n=1 Tax=Paenibacillus tengchongensis TaxID=2608684 RepID=UPI00124CBA2E|nr:phosphotransferase [Paenibacillus tengchongensis]
MKAEILDKALLSLCIKPADCKLIGGYSGNVFEIDGEAGSILKIIDKTAASEAGLLAEVEWQHFLHGQGVKVARPLRISGNDFIRHIDSNYCCVMYEKINGRTVSPSDQSVWNSDLFMHWGEAMGQIHAAAARYGIRDGLLQWNENKVLRQLDSVQWNPGIRRRWDHYLQELNELPRREGWYGLIHGDLHSGNLLVHEQSLYILDFGDCEYHWFAYDIATAVYHAVQTAVPGARTSLASEFCNAFIKGYLLRNPNAPSLQEIRYFIEYRHLFSFTYHWLYADKSSLTPGQLQYLQQMEQSLADGTPFLDNFG